MSFKFRYFGKNTFCLSTPCLSWAQLKCSVQFSSVHSLSRVRLCDTMNRSTPGLPVHHQLPEFTQTHVHQVGDAIQPSHPLLSPSLPAPNPSQHQSLFQWVNSWDYEKMPILALSLPCPDPHSDLIGVDGIGLGVSLFFKLMFPPVIKMYSQDCNHRSQQSDF